MLVKPHHIVLYSKCPRRLLYAYDAPTIELSPSAEIIASVIKRVHEQQSRIEKLVPWRQVPGITERFMNKVIHNRTNNQAYLAAQDVLYRLTQWHRDVYLNDCNDSGAINLPIIIGLGHCLTYFDTIDILGISNITRIYDFVECPNNKSLEAYGPKRVYNDLIMHIKLWGFKTFSGVVPDEFVRIIIGPSRLKAIKVTINKKTIEKGDKIVKYILEGIRNGIAYPSMSTQCLDCPYVKQCSF